MLSALLVLALAAKPGVVARTESRAPWVGVNAGIGVSLSGAGNAARLGVKAGLVDLSGPTGLGGVELVLPLNVELNGATTGFELTPGLEVRRPFSPVVTYGGVHLGYAHGRTIVPTAFQGYTVDVRHAFVARLVGGASYAVTRQIDLWVEPINFGLYVGGTPSLELAFSVGGGFRF